ncbi:MAG TPA: hypothetical protein VK454_03280 [Myxococcaceae bacterium]|nr:hypothetical protein [Myxococcaceae bacterium]
MPSRSLVRSFVALWWVLGGALMVGSIQTILDGLDGKHGVNPHLVALGSVEAVAALLFLIPATLRIGAAGLLLTFAVAFGVHVSLHQFRWDLLIYAAAVLFVAVHGTLTSAQWRHALARSPG